MSHAVPDANTVLAQYGMRNAEAYRTEIEMLTSPEDITAYIEALEQRWGIAVPEDGSEPGAMFEEMDYPRVTDFALQAMNLSTRIADLSESDLYELTKAQRTQVVLLYHHVKKHADLFANPQVAIRICNLISILCFSEKLVHCAHRVKRIGVDGSNQILVDPKSFKSFPAIPVPLPPELDGENNNTQFQSLLLYLLDKAQDLGYYKYNGDVYKQIMTIDGRKTYAWQRVYGIKDFVYDVTDKETNREQWKNLTHGKNNAVSAAEYLASCRDVQFPELKKDRNVFAFRNGLYFARLDQFWHYSSNAPPPAGVVAAANFFDLDFQSEVGGDWYDIPTPNLQKILDYQDFPEDVCKWMYAFLGRLLYDVGDLDGWQVIPFCKGQAASGKSTILLKVAKIFYDKVDVGILSNNIEKKFGISAFCDKYMFVAPEIKGDLQLEQAEFQSIVSGEDVQVAVKHSTAQSVMWKTPGILAGNEVPNWTDNSGSITRRIVIWEFTKSVENGGEMDLDKKLAKEIGLIILKCNRAYHSMVEKVGKDNIWQHLPKYFIERRQELLACTNTLVSFIQSDQVTLGKELYVPFDMFRSAFNQYCQDNHMNKPKINKEFWFYPFKQFGLHEELVATRMYRGQMLHTKWVLGIDIKSSEADHAI